MSSSPANLPNNVIDCHVMIRELQTQLQAITENEDVDSFVSMATREVERLRQQVTELQKTIAEQAGTIEQLQEDYELMKRDLFGPRRERFTEDDPQQLLLFDTEPLPDAPKEDSNQAEEPPRKKRTSKGRQKLVFSDLIPRERVEIELNDDEIPEEMRDNPRARRFFKKVNHYFEFIPPQLKLIEQFQEVIALDQEDGTSSFAAASRPPVLFSSFASPSFLAYLTASRFADHLPYYRIEDIVGRWGMHLNRSTQCRLMKKVAAAVTRLTDLMWGVAIRSSVLAVDETPVKELASGGCLTGYLWTAVGDRVHPYDCFFYSSDRRSIRPETFLKGFQGHLLCDAYVGYERIGALWDNVTV